MSSSSSDMLPVVQASVMAGLISRGVLHPIDTVKVLRQMQSTDGASRCLVQTLGEIRGIGLRELYRGFVPALVGTVPGVALYFTSYEYSRTLLSGYSNSRMLVDFTAGFLAEAVSCIAWVPSDVLKERAQAMATSSPVSSGTRSPYAYGASSVRRVIQTEGIRGLYRGYCATLVAFGPFSAFYFMFVEQLKSACRDYNESSTALPFSQLVSCCAIAGGGAALVTAPLDLVKVRMQVDRDRAGKYRTVWSSLRNILAEDGIRGLWRGGASRVWFAVPNTAITMSLVESIKNRLA